MSKEKKGLLFYLVIEGKAAQELFAAGPEDIMDYFLPKWIGDNYKKQDVLICKLENEIEGYTHKENYQRPDKPIKRKVR